MPPIKPFLVFILLFTCWDALHAADSTLASGPNIILVMPDDVGYGDYSSLGTPGIDLGWIGHFDLSDSMGIAGDFTNPRFTTAEADIIAAGREVGTPLGWLANNGAQARDGIARGFRALCLSTDVALLRSALATEIAAAKT